MKVYAVDNENNCVELSFASEDEADRAFNDILATKMGVGEITDSTGKKKVVNVFCGYSKDKLDIISLLQKER